MVLELLSGPVQLDEQVAQLFTCWRKRVAGTDRESRLLLAGNQPALLQLLKALGEDLVSDGHSARSWLNESGPCMRSRSTKVVHRPAIAVRATSTGQAASGRWV